jgi:hypothetical protein
VWLFLRDAFFVFLFSAAPFSFLKRIPLDFGSCQRRSTEIQYVH